MQDITYWFYKMGMALGAITNDRHGLPAEQAEIGIGVVEELGHPAGSKNCAMKELTQEPGSVSSSLLQLVQILIRFILNT